MTPTIAPDRVSEARDTARLTHRDYTQHVVRRNCCTGGRLCPVGQELLERADDAGKRWEMAESHAGRAAPGGPMSVEARVMVLNLVVSRGRRERRWRWSNVSWQYLLLAAENRNLRRDQVLARRRPYHGPSPVLLGVLG